MTPKDALRLARMFLQGKAELTEETKSAAAYQLALLQEMLTSLERLVGGANNLISSLIARKWRGVTL